MKLYELLKVLPYDTKIEIMNDDGFGWAGQLGSLGWDKYEQVRNAKVISAVAVGKDAVWVKAAKNA